MWVCYLGCLVLATPVQDMMGGVTLSQPEGSTHKSTTQRTTQQQKSTYSQRAHIHGIKRSQEHKAQEIKETAPLNPIVLLPQKVTP